MVEQWSPKPKVKGSNPFSPVSYTHVCHVFQRKALCTPRQTRVHPRVHSNH
jgi:hypothetical protein